MEIRFVRSLLYVIVCSNFAEMAVYKEAQIKVSIYNWTGEESGHTYIPDGVALNIVTDDKTFSLKLRRSKRQNRRIPIITDVGNSMQRRDFEMHEKGAWIFEKRNASFSLKFAGGKISSCRGFFYTSNNVYTVQPDNRNFTSHIILEHPYHAFNFEEDERIPGDEEILPMTKTSKRTKRQIRLYEIELFIVVDFALFLQLTSIKQTETQSSVDVEEALEDSVHQFAIIVSGIDARFKSMQGSGYVLDVILVGIYIAQTVSSSSWSEAVKEESSTRHMVNEKSVKLFTEWMKRHQHHFPEFDHAMAFTAYNLRKDDNQKTLGLGYTQSMCTDRRFSIVEHHGDVAYVSYIATHELAHSLGAKHDGYPARVVYGDRAKTCRADDGYIMCPKASRDPDLFGRKWHFSDCSLLYFDFFIDHLNENKTNCLAKSSYWYEGKNSTLYIEDQPNVYSPDEQCERKHGEEYVLDRKAISDNISSICHSIPCINPIARGPFIPTLPLEGTTCGYQRICHLGQCVDDTSISHYGENATKADDCVFGDQPGVIAGSGLSCQQLLEPLYFAYKCYTYERQCCDTCARHRRQFTAIMIANCPYGDRKESCSVVECDTDLCCETCAIIAEKLKECPVMNAPDHGNVTFNTKTIRHGTVATFSCTNGFHLTGNRTATCLQNGLWETASPKCVKGCLLPTSYPQTTIETANTDVVEVGSIIRIKCENDFVLEGNSTVECKKDTSWDNVFPKCSLVFTSPSVVYVPENIKTGSVVHRVFTGNASSLYRLVYFSHPGFKVTEYGSVEVDDNREIDFEDIQTYALVIEATSKQDPRFKAKQKLVIHVEDVNEFEPTFLHERYCTFLQKPFIEGMHVFTVSAADEDAFGFNISYKIQNSADIADIFRINSLTGDIKVSNADPLNNSENSVYMLTINAVDSGKPRLTGTCVIQIGTNQECEQNGSVALNCCSLQNYLTVLYIILYNLYVYHLIFKRTSLH